MTFRQEPGSSSRTSDHVFKQLPMRDEAAMDTLDQPVNPEVKGMDKDGWSNSPAVDDAPKDSHPEVEPPQEVKPGFSNAKAVKADNADAQAEAKVVDDAEDKAVKTPAKKTAAKSAAKKKG